MQRTKYPIQKRRSKPGPVGVRDKYPQIYEQTEKLARLGATNKQLAEFFNVSVKTIEQWLETDAEFYEAKKKGGLIADMKVAESLYKCATGFHYTEEEVRVYRGRIIKAKVKKYNPPHPTSAMFWLQNRQREQWRNVQKISHEHSGEVRHKAVKDLPIEDLTKEEQEFLYNIGMKQLEQAEPTETKQRN